MIVLFSEALRGGMLCLGAEPSVQPSSRALVLGITFLIPKDGEGSSWLFWTQTLLGAGE